MAVSYAGAAVLTGAWFLRGTWLDGVVGSRDPGGAPATPDAIDEPASDD